jgi:hypothetical protein
MCRQAKVEPLVHLAKSSEDKYGAPIYHVLLLLCQDRSILLAFDQH